MMNLPRIEEHEGAVYWFPKRHRFAQIRAVLSNGTYLLGGLTEYYSSAKTVRYSDAPVSPDFLAEGCLVEAVDAIEGVYHDGIGWRAKKPEEATHP